jgi:WASH complex subunit strumpellin
MFKNLLEEKEKKWNLCKEEANKRVLSLSKYFSGEEVLSKENKDEQLEAWFKDKISVKILDLNYIDSTLAGRKIHQLINALEEVEEFYQVIFINLK